MKFSDFKKVEVPTGKKHPGATTEQLAEICDCTTRTIREHVSQGMPVFMRAKRGQAHRYILPHCMRWLRGREILRQLDFELLDTLPTVLLADVEGGGDGEQLTFAAWQSWARDLARAMQYSDEDFDAALDLLVRHGLINRVGWNPRFICRRQ